MVDARMMSKIRVFGALMKNVAMKSKKANLNNVMQKHSAERTKKYGLFLTDTGVKAWFKFNKSGEMDWGLSYKGVGKDVDTEVFTDFDTLMCLKLGKIKVRGDAGELVEYPFEFFDAWKLDKIKFVGEGSTVDVKRFTDLLNEHPEVVNKLVR